MRRHTIPAVVVAVLLVTAFWGIPYAAPLEFHGGVYTSYEYTDNYNLTAHDKESESIYEVGPSGQIIYQEGPARFDVSGHVTRNFHKRFSDSNFYGVFLDSRFSTSTALNRDSLSLGYSFTQTDRRDTLTDVVGKSKIHLGSVNYTRDLTRSSRLGLGYTYGLEVNEAPYNDVESHGATGTLFHQFSQRNSGTLMIGYPTHNYTENDDEATEIDDIDDTNDTEVLRSALTFQSLVTQQTTLGTDLEYQHQNNETTPDGDIYSAFLTWGYSLTQQTSILLSGGYSWVDMEGIDREGSYVTRAELTTRTLVDVITIRIAREYTAEFTADRFGTYDTRTVFASWERTLLRDLVLLSTISYEDRKPVSAVELTYPDQEDQEEKEYSGMISLNWTPLRYLSITPSYEHRQRDFETADTQRENRYRIIAEVRY
ncbi:MAG TPA: hypothetical protein PLF54_05580 [Deltaproteobacteria bacterium]|nr:hypothetical protein [Deltaproteobacteria bacterium]